jgi:hypothetical protein
VNERLNEISTRRHPAQENQAIGELLDLLASTDSS